LRMAQQGEKRADGLKSGARWGKKKGKVRRCASAGKQGKQGFTGENETGSVGDNVGKGGQKTAVTAAAGRTDGTRNYGAREKNQGEVLGYFKGGGRGTGGCPCETKRRTQWWNRLYVKQAQRRTTRFGPSPRQNDGKDTGIKV